MKRGKGGWTAPFLNEPRADRGKRKQTTAKLKANHRAGRNGPGKKRTKRIVVHLIHYAAFERGSGPAVCSLRQHNLKTLTLGKAKITKAIPLGGGARKERCL